jgi:hypothetical protein
MNYCNLLTVANILSSILKQKHSSEFIIYKIAPNYIYILKKINNILFYQKHFTFQFNQILILKY